MDQWLVRTANNIIAGPYSKDQVLKLIQEGKLGLQDEVCQANRYWIFLHENVEVLRQLGINMPRAKDDDEVTETQTDNRVRATREPSMQLDIGTLPETPSDYEGGTALISRGTFNDAKSSACGQREEDPEPEIEFEEDTSAEADSRPQLQAAPTPQGRNGGNGIATNQARTMFGAVGTSVVSPREGTIERSSVWKTLAWVMVLVVCAIVYAVLRILQMQESF